LTGKQIQDSIPNNKHIALEEFIHGQSLNEGEPLKTQNQSNVFKSAKNNEQIAPKPISPRKMVKKYKTSMQEYKISGVKVAQTDGRQPNVDSDKPVKKVFDDDMKQFISNLSSEISTARFQAQSRRNIRSQMHSRVTDESEPDKGKQYA
jgi:hypothetical protein